MIFDVKLFPNNGMLEVVSLSCLIVGRRLTRFTWEAWQNVGAQDSGEGATQQ